MPHNRRRHEESEQCQGGAASTRPGAPLPGALTAQPAKAGGLKQGSHLGFHSAPTGTLGEDAEAGQCPPKYGLTASDGVSKEPLPERWVDLINHLNERERAQQVQDQKDERSRQAPRRQVH
jgi:hypothetical protein